MSKNRNNRNNRKASNKTVANNQQVRKAEKLAVEAEKPVVGDLSVLKSERVRLRVAMNMACKAATAAEAANAPDVEDLRKQALVASEAFEAVRSRIYQHPESQAVRLLSAQEGLAEAEAEPVVEAVPEVVAAVAAISTQVQGLKQNVETAAKRVQRSELNHLGLDDRVKAIEVGYAAEAAEREQLAAVAKEAAQRLAEIYPVFLTLRDAAEKEAAEKQPNVVAQLYALGKEIDKESKDLPVREAGKARREAWAEETQKADTAEDSTWWRRALMRVHTGGSQTWIGRAAEASIYGAVVGATFFLGGGLMAALAVKASLVVGSFLSRFAFGSWLCRSKKAAPAAVAA